MPTLLCSLTLEADGRPLADTPRVVTLTGDACRTFAYEILPGGGMFVLPDVAEFTELTALVFTTTMAVDFFLNGQTGLGVPLGAGAVVAFLGLAECQGFPLWALINTSEDVTRIRGVALGRVAL